MTYKSRKYKEPTNPVGTVAELFAGVGGFRIGLAEAGGGFDHLAGNVHVALVIAADLRDDLRLFVLELLQRSDVGRPLLLARGLSHCL